MSVIDKSHFLFSPVAELQGRGGGWGGGGGSEEQNKKKSKIVQLVKLLPV